MTPETRRRVLRYGIATDLVILATGVGLLYPSGSLLLLGVFAGAVALSAWKGTWRAAALAIVLSIAALLYFFTPVFNTSHMIAFIVASIIATAIVESRRATRRPSEVVAATVPAENVIAFDRPPAVDTEALERESLERQNVARAVERAAGAQVEAQRAAGERARLEKDAAERVRREREEAEAALKQRAEEEALQKRLANERESLLTERLRREREEAETALLQRVESERAQIRADIENRLTKERELARIEAERVIAEKLAPEKEELRRSIEERFTAAREQEAKAAEETLQKRLAEERAAIQNRLDAEIASARKVVAAPPRKSSIGSLLTRWFKKTAPQTPIKSKKIVAESTPPRRPVAVQQQPRRNSPARRVPRLLMVERSRGAAASVVPKLKQRGIDVEIVDRWIDGVDEIHRFKPDALLIDCELAAFKTIFCTMRDQRPNLPIFVTGRAAPRAGWLGVRHAGFVVRPYDAEALSKIAQEAMTGPRPVLVKPIGPPPRPSRPRVYSTPPAFAPPAVALGPQTAIPVMEFSTAGPTPAEASELELRPPVEAIEPYGVACFNCGTAFDAASSEFCSCLARERTLVCTTCLKCFCKAPPSYKEKFWVEAPAKLFERKTAEARRHQKPLTGNPAPDEVARPLVLSVEDDEEIQIILQRVCANHGYGFIHASNGQDGLTLARLYRPDLILSDAFMPKLDGREMCRILKDEPGGVDCTMVVMTGLYTDTKYRSEALKRFHVDDYLAKPVSITDLVNLLQEHLDDATPAPTQETESIQPRADVYEVCCNRCHQMFDASRAEWCRCVGREQTLVCPHCGTCFCRAASAYKERFWLDAPPTLFERKMIGSKRSTGGRTNPAPDEVKRPLILLVEDDENIQLIVRTVVTSMGYGFIVGANGQEGLELAREYNPELILSDAFMPKLDGREMCRRLKEDPTTARVKAIIMTGLYTDRKYRNEALDHFKVDDYVAKPVAVDDLIRLFKKHLPQEVQPTM